MSRTLLRFLRHNAALAVGLAMFLLMVGVAVFAPFCAPHDPLKIHIGQRLAPMSANHPLGTDYFGRDLLSRIIFGTRYSLTIGIVSIGFSLLLGGILGTLAGYYSRSAAATLIVWITDITMAFPTYILGAMVAMMFGPGILNTILALAVAFFPRFIRLARGAALSVKEDLYILAARSVGMTDLRLLWIHLVPNIVSPLIVMGVIWMSSAITIEVGLSFLGLGVPPPAPSWGTVLQDSLRMFGMDPVKVLWPCLALAWAVQALNLIGDRFRDALDPRMR
jgi:peptide/nickel transport system permease protein